MTPAERWHKTESSWPLAASSRFVDAGELTFHVQINGQGPDVLLLHGAGSSSHSFAGITRLLAKDYRLIAPDLPGQGFSSLVDPGAAGLAQFTEALTQLLTQLDADPVALIGHSAGAALAAQFALSTRRPLKGILGINSAFTPFGATAAPFFSTAARWLSRSEWLPKILASPALRWRATASMLSDTGSRIDAEMSRCYETLLSNPEHIAGTLRMMAGWDLPPLLAKLPELPCPMWLIACEADKTIPPARALSVASELPIAVTRTLAGLGHLGHEEAPERFVTLFQEMTTLER